ncbi:MAG: DUF6541 family protein [Gemmatimonadaceae bacterium]
MRELSSILVEWREPVKRLLWRADTRVGLVAMFCIAFLLRVAIAPHLGFFNDLNTFHVWSSELRSMGARAFYANHPFLGYPPGNLYSLWLTGRLSAAPGYLILKLPALLGDLALAWIAGIFAVRIAPPSVSERVPVRAAVAAGVLFNPAVIALSAVWGQLNVVSACFALGSLLLLVTGAQSLRREVGAFLLLGIAFSMNPQVWVLIPVMAYALYSRYQHRKSSGQWIRGAPTVGLLLLISAAVCVVTGFAFGLNWGGVFEVYRWTSNLNPVTSANAFNFWGVVGFWRHDATGDAVVRAMGLSAARLGLFAFIAAGAYALWRTRQSAQRGVDQGQSTVLAAAALSLLGFTLLTRMHERDLFLVLACLAPLVFLPRFRIVYAAISGLFLLNLWYPFAAFNTQHGVTALRFEPWFDWIYGGFATDTWQKKMWSLAVTAVVAAVALRGTRWLEEFDAIAVTPQFPRPVWDLSRVLRSARGLAGAEDDTEAAPPRILARSFVIPLVCLSCVFGLAVLRGEIRMAQDVNDSSFHFAMVRWASRQLQEGRMPLDGWFPNFALGSSFFHHYQSLPHTVTAFVANVSGAGSERVYRWFLYLLLALWPLAVYLSARLLDWSRWTAASAAAISPLIISAPGYGYSHGSYTWQGYGLYSQEWGMWLLPLTWGLTWRAVSRGNRYAAAALALALTMACHFTTGYLALLTIGVWVLVFGMAGFARRVSRAAIVGGGSLLVAAWVLVPLLGDMKYSARSEYYTGTIFNDSYGASKVLSWLFTGGLFDFGRFPVVTLIVAVGAVLCIARARDDVRARALLGAFVLSLLLFFGRPTFGRVLDFLPGFGDMQIHRFIMGVDLAGILLAGVGLGWLSRGAYSLALRFRPSAYAIAGAAAVILSVGALAPAWRHVARYDQRGYEFIRNQLASDANDGRDLDRLLDNIRQRHDGRVYAGMKVNWGEQYRSGIVPVHVWLGDRDIDEVGFVFRTITSLSTDIEAAFDERNPAQYEMLNVRYVLVPIGRTPSVPAKLIAQSGQHRLYEVQTTGYFQVVDRTGAVSADRTTIQQATKTFRNSDLATKGIYPGVAFAGGPQPAPTFTGASPPSGPAGIVVSQSNTLEDGAFDATVDVVRPAVVLLKATYDPRWTATVDGITSKPIMMAPSLVGVDVSSGRHLVAFRYKPYAWYPLLLLIGAVTVSALIFVPRRVKRSN